MVKFLPIISTLASESTAGFTLPETYLCWTKMSGMVSFHEDSLKIVMICPLFMICNLSLVAPFCLVIAFSTSASVATIQYVPSVPVVIYRDILNRKLFMLMTQALNSFSLMLSRMIYPQFNTHTCYAVEQPLKERKKFACIASFRTHNPIFSTHWIDQAKHVQSFLVLTFRWYHWVCPLLYHTRPCFRCV